jgi:predicted patatin/cPLA2 family phospholipase
MTVRALATVLALTLLLGACTGQRLLPAPPEDVHAMAEIPGFENVRQWGDAHPDGREAEVALFAEQVRARAAREGALPNGGALHSLVLSGGGSDGPFGAGLLVGWSEMGTRPEFGIVTGISAGALIAPFAFLGPDYDKELMEFTLEGSTDTLVTFQILAGLLDGVGLIDNSKLWQKLRGLITPDVVRSIAREHEKGRRLLIGTTNLDAQRPVYWQIDKIASQGFDRPQETADLITKIIIASASIPGAFPPQFFTVEAAGRRYSEMHVDGGVTNQLFFLPIDRRLSESLPPDIRGYAARGTLYVIRNTKLSPDYEPVPPGLVQIAGRSISTMIKFGGRGDIAILEARARDAGFGVKVTAVPESFRMEATELFDPKYMQALFRVGREMADDPDTWITEVAPRSRAPVPRAAAAGSDRRAASLR